MITQNTVNVVSHLQKKKDKDFLTDKQSYKCNLTEIRIPDGGSCSEWCVSTILLAENKTSDIF